MEIGKFTKGNDDTLRVMCNCQVLQFAAFGVAAADVSNILAGQVKVWNNTGKLIPVTPLSTLAMMNSENYPIIEGVDTIQQLYNIVIHVAICEQGSLSPVIYVKYQNSTNTDVILSAFEVRQQTAVYINNYNSMLVTSPQKLPKNSMCAFMMQDVNMLQKNNDVMSLSEILVHSQYLKDNLFKGLHPVWYDATNTTVIDDEVYTCLANEFALGYGDITTGGVVIFTGNDEITLYPNLNSPAPIYYCQRQMTAIASQLWGSLVASGQANNVNSEEFANGVASIGLIASQQNLSPSVTKPIAERVARVLPSAVLGRVAGVNNMNLFLQGTRFGLYGLLNNN